MSDIQNKFPIPALAYSAFCGVAYGLFVRFLGNVPDFRDTFAIMTVGFIFLAPLAMGAITVLIISQRPVSVGRAILWPWVSVLVGCAASMVMGWEGRICVAMYLPVGLILSSFGGVIARLFTEKNRVMVLAAFALLPMVAQIAESHMDVPLSYSEVHSQIRVHATPEGVWRQIKNVRAISRDEMPDSWVHRLGFPRPVEAVVDGERLGGVREARFERGLTFRERIDQWNPPLQLGFDIQTEPVPPSTLDEHVTIGGKYFDVLHGEYSLEESGADVILHLRSQFRISTRFNFYASLWTNLVMQRIQDDILQVIRARAEADKV